ncbi:hypothetical protein [[Mycoplasma] phocidae]|nr:hypothetical protein [[Mycoplasma] phocae]
MNLKPKTGKFSKGKLGRPENRKFSGLNKEEITLFFEIIIDF